MKYLDASIAYEKTPKEAYRADFQQLLNEQFYNSSNWFTIQEETSIGSESYQNIDVRITRVIDPSTGQNRGDDWKELLFNDIDKETPLGSIFQFESNYWIVVNTQNIANLTPNVTVRRCNNTLRWIDDSGGYHVVPCVLDYNIQENRDYATAGSAFVNPSGILPVITQLNDKTNTIRPNDRFLFGNSSNWTGYRIFGGGINNFAFNSTTVSNSRGLLKLTMGVNFVNEDTDNLTLGIADAYATVYTLTLDQSAISGDITQTQTLTPTITLNGNVVSRDVTWSSTDTDIATVSSVGVVTFVAVGTCTIRCQLENNTGVYDTCGVTVLASPADVYSVAVSPTTNYLYEEKSQTYEVYLYKNGVQQANAFVFTVTSSGVPTTNYTFTSIDDNSFSVTNIERYLDEPLVISAVSGIYSLNVSIRLLGAW